VIDPAGDKVDYQYYANDRLETITGHRPALSNAPSCTGVTGSIITPYPNLPSVIGYAPLGKTSSFTNPKNLQTIFEYDEAGRIIRWYQNVSNPLYTTFVYDLAGQLLFISDRMGGLTAYEYYNSGYVQSVQFPDWIDRSVARAGTTVAGKNVVYQEYDYTGRVLSLTDSEIPGTTNYAYDLAGNCLLRQDADGFTLEFTYDTESQLTGVTESKGDFALALILDNLGRTASLADSKALDGSLTWNFQYTKHVGRTTKVLHLYKRSISGIKIQTEFDYDARNQLISIQNRCFGKAVSSQSFTYRDDRLLNAIAGDQSNNFLYDGIKQLVFEQSSCLVSDYDTAGNRLFRANPSTNPAPSQYDILNRETNEPSSGGTFTYDDNGNTSTASYPTDAFRFSFDGAGKLRTVNTNKGRISYLYDIDGNLVRRVSQGRLTAKQTLNFHNLFRRPVVIEKNGKISMILTWDITGSLLRIRRQAKFKGSRTYPNSAFAFQDGFKSLIQLLQASGMAICKISYDVWGDLISTSGDTSAALWTFRCFFTDPETSLKMMGSRWYRSSGGRWISEDQITSKGINSADFTTDFSNLYCYVSNDPVNHSDSSGFADDNSTVVPGSGYSPSNVGTTDDSDAFLPPLTFFGGDEPDSYFGLSLNLDTDMATNAAGIITLLSSYGPKSYFGSLLNLNLPDYSERWNGDPYASTIGPRSPNLTEENTYIPPLGLSWFQSWGDWSILKIPSIPFRLRGWGRTGYNGDPVVNPGPVEVGADAVP
jgi:RHS repeat-associated protein